MKKEKKAIFKKLKESIYFNDTDPRQCDSTCRFIKHSDESDRDKECILFLQPLFVDDFYEESCIRCAECIIVKGITKNE